MEVNNTAGSGDLNLERLAGFARLINGFKAAQGVGEPIKIRKDNFDGSLDSPALKTIKAAIPYIDRRYRRELGVMVKLIEIDRLLNDFKETNAASLESGSDNMAMLRAIVPNLPKENRQMGETLIKLLEIKSIWELKEATRGV